MENLLKNHSFGKITKKINFINQIYYHISTIELYFNNSQRNIVIKYH